MFILLENQMLLDEARELARGEPNKFLAWVKLKLSEASFSVIGDVL